MQQLCRLPGSLAVVDVMRVVCVEQFPWHPQLDEWNPRWSLVAEDMQYMQRWGFNGVRLGESHSSFGGTRP